jgi:hypothetical protein
LQPPSRESLAFQQERVRSLGDRLAEAAALRAFVGRLGEGRAFPVGPKFSKVMSEGGLLSLRWSVPRELAGAGQFSATVRIEPPPRPDGNSDGNNAATNGNAGANEANSADSNTEVTRPAEPVLDNGTAETPANARNEASIATPPPVQPPPAGVDEANSNDYPIAPEPSPSADRLAILAPLAVGLLLVLAGAGLGLKQRRARLRLQRTRALLHVSPSLDLAEGACRGDDLPAEGPAARFEARLDDGALRWTGGGEDG